MSNRLIGLLIILAFILGITGFYYYGKNISDEKIRIKKDQIKKIEQEKVILKKIEKITKIEKQENNSIFDENLETKNQINKNLKIKLQKKIANILYIDNFLNIKIYDIYGEKKYFLVKSKKNKKIENYLFNKKNLNFNNLELNINIIYAKKIDNKIIFVTEKGSFIYQNNKIEYFSLFSDFIIKNGNYIGIVKNKDISRKKNFNLENKSGDLIILKNPNTQKTKFLYNTDFEIKKILLENNQVIIVDEKDNEYFLEY